MSQDCGWTNQHQWFRYRAAAIIVEEGMVLFAKTDKEDYYYSVGGAVHLGETAKHACLREVFEETGCIMQSIIWPLSMRAFLAVPAARPKGWTAMRSPFIF